MNIKVDFDNIVVREDRNDTIVKVLMLKGEKGDQGDGEPNVIEKVQVNGVDLTVTNKTVNVPVPIVDSSISSSSTNPVQNKAIYDALSDKVDNSALDNYYEISEIDAMMGDVDKKPYYFDNVASMKAYNLKAGDYAITKGYYSANDGGGAEYEIRNSTSNDIINEMNIIEITETLIAELIANDINIKQLGAKGDNTNDDSQYFSFALNNYNKILLNDETYLISQTINCNKSNIFLIGKNSKIVINTSGHGFIFKNINNIQVNNIEFTSQTHYNSGTATNANNHIIKIYNCNNIRFIENTLNYGRMGLTIGKADNIEIKNNIISNFKGWGLYLGCDENFTYNTTNISNCHINNNKTYNTGYDGIKLTGYIENINIYNNISYNNARDGIDYAGHTAKNIQIYNNNCYDNEMNGIDFKNLDRQDYPYNNDFTKQFENIHIHDNILYNNKEHSINSQLYYQDLNIHNILINNNIITLRNEDTSTVGTGIRIGSLITNFEDAIIIKNNIIKSSTSQNNYGIRLSNTQNVKIINNNIKDALLSCIYIDYIADLYTIYGAISDNNKIINNDLKTTINYTNAIHGSDTNVSNLLVKNNKLNTLTNAYLINPAIINGASNICVDNEYSGELFSATPTIRTTKGVIYKSKDPITTQCVGWIGYANSSSPQYYVYIPITS